ncbi:MAG: hypothetical protein EKK55_07100 [Rhodocyclaceae bacterium]|nr:MAG: hypothetical protein EKK55_07100 [Rhodocyclaceae bacterium]
MIDRPQLPGESKDAWRARQAGPRERIDPAAVLRLNKLVDFGAAFVVSSTWRGRDPESGEVLHPPDKLQGYLRAAGFTGQVIGVTPEINRDERWVEIEAWVNAQPVPPAALAILDDWSMGPLSARHVRTDYDTRLTDRDVERALAILRSQLGPQKGARRDRRAIPPSALQSPAVTPIPLGGA